MEEYMDGINRERPDAPANPFAYTEITVIYGWIDYDTDNW